MDLWFRSAAFNPNSTFPPLNKCPTRPLNSGLNGWGVTNVLS